MPFAGRALLRPDPLAHADAMVVLGAFRLERTFEAGSLYNEGWSGRVILLRSPYLASPDLLRRVRVRVPIWIDIQKDALVQMGVPSNAIIESTEELENTRREAAWVTDLARRSKWRRILVVTSPYHTGRAGRYFRAAAGPSLDIVMRANRFERIDPDHWWRHAVDRHDVVYEYMSLAWGLISSS